MSKISELSDGGVVQGGDTLIAVRSGGNVKVTYGGSTTANIDGGTIDGTVIGGTTPAAGSFTDLSFGGDFITATATELNVLDGITATTAELNVLDGITATTAELNYTDGVTSNIQTQLNTKAPIDDATFTGTTTIPTADINGGTIDGVTIGGASAGAGTFTTLGATGDVSIADKIVHTGDTNTAIRFPAADTVTVETAGTERMRIDSSGNVGIGTTSPESRLTVYSPWDTDGGARKIWINSRTDSSREAYIEETQYSNSSRRGFKISGCEGGLGNGAFAEVGNLFVRFSGFGSEHMRIDSSGNLLVGTTNLSIEASTAGGAGFVYNNQNGLGAFARNSSNKALSISKTSNVGNGTFVEFFYDGSTVGTIGHTTTATSYNTSSDYRLKENVVDMTDAIDRVKALPVRRFNFITDPDKTVDGFLAHEAQKIVPESVTGEKDAVDKDGKPEYQGIDQAKLVPLLTGALKEAIARIETLEAEVATLKGA